MFTAKTLEDNAMDPVLTRAVAVQKEKRNSERRVVCWHLSKEHCRRIGKPRAQWLIETSPYESFV